MADFRASRGRDHRRRALGIVACAVGPFMFVMALWSGQVGPDDRGPLIAVAAAVLGVGLLLLLYSFRLPVSEIMKLAEARHGLLTLSEIASTLDVDPRTALKALRRLQKIGIAAPRWQEIRKNIWEFPDYMHLPISETIELAKHRGGRVRVEDLVAAGHNAEVARQTLSALSEAGLAQPDADAGTDQLVIETQ